jgi:hypothetical protein
VRQQRWRRKSCPFGIGGEEKKAEIKATSVSLLSDIVWCTMQCAGFFSPPPPQLFSWPTMGAQRPVCFVLLAREFRARGVGGNENRPRGWWN